MFFFFFVVVVFVRGMNVVCVCVKKSYTNIEKYDACGGNSFQRKHRRLKSISISLVLLFTLFSILA